LAQLHVFVRDCLVEQHPAQSRDGHVLIDSGYGRHAPLMLALFDSDRGPVKKGSRRSSTHIATPTTSAATRRSRASTTAR
jgi:hypothetical protein